MKKSIIYSILGVIIPVYFCFSQNETENLKKYWNYRDRLQKYFVRIGEDAFGGYSICASNREYNPSQGSSLSGHAPNAYIMRWGDAAALHGEYLSVLAIEYKLRKDAGLDLSGILNELYYAINVVNRLDKKAESYLSSGSQSENLNGFFMRDDIPGNFYTEWQSKYSTTLDSKDNVVKIDGDAFNVEWGATNTFNPRNEMSQDQMIGLFVGFALIKKFVANVYVKPRPSDQGFYLLDEVAAIATRMINRVSATYEWNTTEPCWLTGTGSYLTTNRTNWIAINPVTGSPVQSGTNLDQFKPFAYTFVKAANTICSGGFTQSEVIFYDKENETVLCPDIHLFLPYPLYVAPWNKIENTLVAITNNQVANLSCNWPYTSYCDKIFDQLTADFNVHMALAMATISNTWTHQNIKTIGNYNKMPIFDLLYAVLYDRAPLNPQSYYTNILNTAPCKGPYSYSPTDHDPYWFENSIWNHPKFKGSGAFIFGDFSGNDYMWLYNLYHIAFKNTGTLPTYVDNSCQCASAPRIEANITGQNLSITLQLDHKFSEYSDINIPNKEYLTHSLNIINAAQLNNYTDLVICNNSTLIVNSGTKLVVGRNLSSIIKGSLQVRAGSTLILRSGSTLTVNEGSKLFIEPGATILIEPGVIIQLTGPNALIDVQSNTSVTIPLGQQLLITQTSVTSKGGTIQFAGGTFSLGGTLINEECNIKIGTGMNFNFNPGASLQMKGNDAVLDFAGNLNLAPNSFFTFTYPGSNSGYIRFSQPGFPSRNITGGTNSTFYFNGQGITDKVLEIAQETMYVPDVTSQFIILNGSVSMAPDARLAPLGLNTRITLLNSRFTSTSGTRNTHRGLTIFGQPNVSITSFTFENGRYGIFAFLSFGGSPLTLTNCRFNNCDYGLYSYDKGITLNNCSFNGNTTQTNVSGLGYGWYAEAMTFPCAVNNSSFGNTTGNTRGVSYNSSSAELRINNSNMINNYTGAEAKNAAISFRCSRVNRNTSTGIYGNENSTLIMDKSIASTGAQLHAEGNNINILLEKAKLIRLDGGYNNLTPSVSSPNQASVYGSVMLPACQPFTIVANKNKWKRPGVFSSSDYSISGVFFSCIRNDTKITDGSPLVCVSEFCGILPNPFLCNISTTTLAPPLGGTILNTSGFKGVTLEGASITIDDYYTAAKSTNDYVKIITLSTEILNLNLINLNSHEQAAIRKIYQRMTASSSALAQSAHAEKKSLQQFNSSFSKIVSAESFHASQQASSGSLQEQLYTLIDQAFAHRINGDLPSALNILNQASSIAQSNEINYVNRLTCLFSAEKMVKEGVLKKEDFESYISMNCPMNAGKPRIRNATANEMREENTDNKNRIHVYPNPLNVDEMTVVLSNMEYSNLEFIIFDLSGKELYKTKLPDNEKEIKITGFNLPNGVYLYRINSGGSHIQQDKLTVIR